MARVLLSFPQTAPPRRREGGNMENQQQSGKPWAAFNIIERGEGAGKKRIWSRVGSAFKNRDGSFNIYLDSFPLGGKVQIR
ncbi:MAG: hypothetical protein ACXWLM_09235, partial [Myxococcales bacterium]